MNKKITIYIFPILCIGLLVAIDQLTKFIVCSSLSLYETKPLIKDVFHLTYIHNSGAAWGMFKGQRVIFIILTIIFLILGGCIYAKLYRKKRFIPVRICIIFLVSGAIGNMIDRIKLCYVIDFFDFRLINFPVFNVADIYITVSMILLLFLLLFVYKEEEFEEIISFKKKDLSKDLSKEEKEEEK